MEGVGFHRIDDRIIRFIVEDAAWREWIVNNNVSVVRIKPRFGIGRREVVRIVNLGIESHGDGRADVVPQSSIGRSVLGQDKHNGPIRGRERAVEGVFIRPTWQRRATRMGVNPDPGKLVRRPSFVDLSIEEVGNRFVIELDGHRGAALSYEFDVDDQQWVVGIADTESTDFAWPRITQAEQL
ncbi:hypothetical protein Q31b_57370 [Novipirellula aureliae]|uniref:Uncharacterized protein n=1 Tax=Novipirellula aureliae TaxID=2527966 RepID=A0A5C6D987_9BACT|nr:hypothetical protein Q31b_57370 [Novipirellula aureliae]